MSPDELGEEMSDLSDDLQSLIIRSKQQKEDIIKARTAIAEMKEAM